MAVEGVSAASPVLEWKAPERRHREQIAEIVAETGVFRPDEIDVAQEVFDDFCSAPGRDYWAVGVYTASERLAGFAIYGPTPCTVDTWDLYWIAVRPDMQRTGAGRGLMERAEREMREAGARMCVIEASSRQGYAATRGFYRACGYEEVARVPDFYEAGDDRVTYAKRFT
jgi:ribosomal protein S18 acetylase RimI-like enzyme